MAVSLFVCVFRKFLQAQVGNELKETGNENGKMSLSDSESVKKKESVAETMAVRGGGLDQETIVEKGEVTKKGVPLEAMIADGDRTVKTLFPKTSMVVHLSQVFLFSSILYFGLCSKITFVL